MESEGEEEQHETEVIIPGDYEEYDHIGAVRANNCVSANPLGNSTKGKYYKQTYRTAWEHMPDFKGWLRGVAGQPTRAYCVYCQKTLHAHRLSLLKHMCTIRHQKAAQLHNNRKVSQDKLHIEVTFDSNVSANEEEEEQDLDLSENMVQQYSSATIENSEEQQVEEIEEEEESITIEGFPVQLQKEFRQQIVPNMPNGGKTPISTHVLDTSKGAPVSGLQVSLYKLIEGRWTYINEGTTTIDGRFSNFLEQLDFTPGRYKLHYDVDRYFDLKKQESLYPFIEIVFDHKGPGEHYHIPLLLSPYGYTTYRGS